MGKPKACTCEHYKEKEPHEYTCNMNINQHAKVKEPNNMRSLENATARPLHEIGRYEIVMRYANDQSPLAWEQLVKTILSTEPLIARAVNAHDALVAALKAALIRIDQDISDNPIAKTDRPKIAAQIEDALKLAKGA